MFPERYRLFRRVAVKFMTENILYQGQIIMARAGQFRQLERVGFG